MKAVQIDRYAKTIQTVLREVPVPEISDTEVLIRVRQQRSTRWIF